jgi:hypothetical protein
MVTMGADTGIGWTGIILAGTNAEGVAVGSETVGALGAAATRVTVFAFSEAELGVAVERTTTDCAAVLAVFAFTDGVLDIVEEDVAEEVVVEFGLEGVLGCKLAICLSNAPTLVTSSISCRKVTFTPNRCRISWLN